MKPDIRVDGALAAEVLRAAAAAPDRVAMQVQRGDRWERLTYAALAERVRALAGALAARGLVPGDRAAILCENRPEWGIAYLGIVAAGGTAVPLDPGLTDREVEILLAHAGATWAFASAPQAARLVALAATPGAPKVTAVSLDDDAPHGLSTLAALLADGRDLPPPAHAPGADQVASIVYTSGTTGTPKGVMLTHRNFLANSKSIADFGLVGPADNILAILPLYHTYAFTITLLLPLLLGATITYAPTLKAPDLTRAMQETGVTLLVGVPQLFAMFHRAIFDEVARRGFAARLLFRLLLRVAESVRGTSGWNVGRLVFPAVHRKLGGRIRIMASGGARLNPAIGQDFVRLGFVMLEGYGLTETAPVLTFTPFERPKLGSVGLPIAGVELRILHPNGDGVGEVAVRGPNVMAGYYRNPEATAAVMQDGWFKTGDLGRRDADGYLVLTGRCKEVIVLSSGKNVYPEEVEEHFQKSPFIKEVCLLSAVGPGGAEGLQALVYPDLDYFKKHRATVSESYIRWDMETYARLLPPHQRPTAARIVKEPFPRTRLGKIQRHLVEAQYGLIVEVGPGGGAGGPARPLSAADEGLVAHPVCRRVMEALQQASRKAGPVHPDDGIEIDLGLDSLSRLELLVSLEQTLSVDLPDDLGAEAFTVRELLVKVRDFAERASGGAGAAAPAVQRTSWGRILAVAPAPDIMQAVENGTTPHARRVTRISVAISAALFRGVFGFRVRGAEHVPATGPCIIAPNHDSYMDAFIVGVAVPFSTLMQTYYMGFEAFFRHPMVARWARNLRVIPVDLDARLFPALQASAYVLRQKRILCVFPEGSRSIDGTPQPFKRGVTILAKELGVPIVPARIRGSFEAWPRFGALPRPHSLEIVFGPAVTADELLARGGSETDPYDRMAARLRDVVIGL